MLLFLRAKPLKSLASYSQLQHCNWTCIKVCFGSKIVNIIEKITTLCRCPAVVMSSVQFKKDKLPQVFVVFGSKPEKINITTKFCSWKWMKERDQVRTETKDTRRGTGGGGREGGRERGLSSFQRISEDRGEEEREEMLLWWTEARRRV